MNADCVILAAGFSSRMGINKMTLEIGGMTVIEQCVKSFYEPCSKIIVVTGKYHKEIKLCLAPYSKVHIAYNRIYNQGMFSSVKEGVRHIESKRFFLTPGDYPLLKSETINHMANTTGYFVSPVYKGQQGHPVLLDKLFVRIILSSKCISLRDCLANTPVQKISVDDRGVVTDIDTIEEYRKIRNNMEK